jgi:hypothetical protein
MFVSVEPFQPTLLFMGKARSLHKSHLGRLRPYSQSLDKARKACQGQTLQARLGAYTRVIWVGFGLTHNHWTRQENLAKAKHSSLLRTFENYGGKNFYNVDTRSRHL